MFTWPCIQLHKPVELVDMKAQECHTMRECKQFVHCEPSGRAIFVKSRRKAESLRGSSSVKQTRHGGRLVGFSRCGMRAHVSHVSLEGGFEIH